jgi:hypothetical protein
MTDIMSGAQGECGDYRASQRRLLCDAHDAAFHAPAGCTADNGRKSKELRTGSARITLYIHKYRHTYIDTYPHKYMFTHPNTSVHSR